MRCIEPGCPYTAGAYDIEAVWDEEEKPVWAIYYDCEEGHNFVAEYERVVKEEKRELVAA